MNSIKWFIVFAIAIVCSSCVTNTIKIGDKVWMAENLNYATNNGSWCYDNNPDCEKYGGLYDWETALNACSIGWCLPSKSDFITLVNNVG